MQILAGSSIYVKAPKGCEYDLLELNESMPYIIGSVNPQKLKIIKFLSNGKIGRLNFNFYQSILLIPEIHPI
jgi:hypothetical protein